MLNLSKPKPPHLQRGEKAEERAYQYLLQKGLQLVSRNYCCKLGEIDLMMHDGDTLVMVEVRYRKNDRFGSAVESITQKKQSRIIAAAKYYLVCNNLNNLAVRFDVVAISGNNHLNWIKNAFQTSY
jgi:putative endonuclease